MKRPIDDPVKLAPKSNSEEEEEWEDEEEEIEEEEDTEEEEEAEEAEGDDDTLGIDEAQKRAKELAQMQPHFLMAYTAALLEQLLAAHLNSTSTEQILEELKWMQGDSEGGGGVYIKSRRR